MKNVQKKFLSLSIAAAAALASSVSFAQTTPTGVDSAPIVTSINGVQPTIIAIGGAVLAVVVLAWGYKVVKGFLGR